MNEGQKTYFTGLAGIVLGVAVALFGVQNLNKLVISKSMELGEKTENLRSTLEDGASSAEDLNQRLSETVQNVKKNEEKASLLLASVEEQQKKLSSLKEEVNDILEKVGIFQEDDANEKLAIVRQLITDLNSQSGTERILKLESAVLEEKGYSKVLSGELEMYAQNTRALDDDSQCPSGPDAHRGIKNARVQFEKPFDNVPEVIVSLKSLTMSGPFRVHLEVISTDKRGFNYRFSTYCNTIVHAAIASWLAVANQES